MFSSADNICLEKHVLELFVMITCLIISPGMTKGTELPITNIVLSRHMVIRVYIKSVLKMYWRNKLVAWTGSGGFPEHVLLLHCLYLHIIFSGYRSVSKYHYKDIGHTGLWSTLINSFCLNYPLKESISSHILKYWVLGL